MARFLAGCRYLLILPVIGSVILTAGVVVMGIARIFRSFGSLAEQAEASANASKMMSVAVIETIDLFLVGTVAYITAVGIYKLFISDLEVKLPIRLKINTLKDLEDKIIGVIVAALAVAFLGKAVTTDDPEALLAYGGGMSLVIVALAFFMRYGVKPDDVGER